MSNLDITGQPLVVGKTYEYRNRPGVGHSWLEDGDLVTVAALGGKAIRHCGQDIEVIRLWPSVKPGLALIFGDVLKPFPISVSVDDMRDPLPCGIPVWNFNKLEDQLKRAWSSAVENGDRDRVNDIEAMWESEWEIRKANDDKIRENRHA